MTLLINFQKQLCETFKNNMGDRYNNANLYIYYEYKFSHYIFFLVIIILIEEDFFLLCSILFYCMCPSDNLFRGKANNFIEPS